MIQCPSNFMKMVWKSTKVRLKILLRRKGGLISLMQTTQRCGEYGCPPPRLSC